MTLTATSSSPMSTAEPDEEWGHVLEGVKKDSGYVTITADEVIKVIGRDIFAARKPNKKREASCAASKEHITGCSTKSVRTSVALFSITLITNQLFISVS